MESGGFPTAVGDRPGRVARSMRTQRLSLLACSFVLAGVLTGCAAPRTVPATPAVGPTPTVARTVADPHAVNVIVGGSFDRAGDGAAVGAQYEYRKDDRWGYGVFGDVAFAKRTSTALGGAVYFHPKEPWTVFGGPGVEFANGDADVFARIGGSYAFDLDEFTLGPIGWIDLGDNAALFIGLAFTFGF